jgi:hypothetical protein
MDDAHGKEIDLQKTTIKIPGANKPRIGKSLIHLNNDINSLNLNSINTNGILNKNGSENGKNTSNEDSAQQGY